MISSYFSDSTMFRIVLSIVGLIVAISGRFVSKEAEDAYNLKNWQAETGQTSFSISQANISAYLSAGAYCNKNSYSSMKFKGPTTGFSLTYTIYDSKTDTQGFIGVLPSDSSIYVVFRGSSSIQNWITNLNAFKTPYTSFPECNCQVHQGFYQAEQIVIGNIVSHVKSLLSSHAGYAVKVTGHSLGAALAQLTSMDLVKNGIAVNHVYNFGQPRTGDVNYAAFVPKKVTNNWRVIHNKDMVPHLPATTVMEFYHICTEEFESSSGSYETCTNTCEDPSCALQYDIAQTNIDDHLVYLNGFHISDCNSAVNL